MALPPNGSSIPVAQVPASIALPQIPSLDNTFGALAVGTLYGVCMHQAYRYFRLYPNDSTWLKSLVAVVLVLETFTSILGAHACYYHLITNYFQPQTLARPSWSIKLHPAVSMLSMDITQSFFIRRVWIIGARFRPLVIFSTICSLTSLGIVVLCLVTLGEYLNDILHMQGSPQPRQCKGFSETTCNRALSSALALVADLLLASVLIYVLHRSRTGIKSTDTMIDLMIMYSISTGLLTGIMDILVTVLGFTLPGQLLYVAFAIPATKLYANTLLAALNSRQRLASCGGSSIVPNEVSAFGFAPPPAASVGETYASQLQRTMRTTNDAGAPAVIELNVATRDAATGDGSASASAEDVARAHGRYYAEKEAV
ncbi:uncharacterized protein TRAVEDRAFT_52851 [Trametes versicolor FP-101664 SS1]|uniref:uncharacterized protein n=1 Tax=Trametes versicolor (strain FP-101664) TaxID=717944 RepID=UPI00046213B5|nr:uncharacterized protein TRAVEDRAFT_52851 [Trametes versicolor FP-101664 SS1]EIW53731.1 hypothetical protein TRAVEDRAFT_52851 [Trametes versicolor FP-101664 SS1]